MAEFMNTREVADYLRLKERKIYDLVRQKRIPCTRVSGKWLFPKSQIDRWLESSGAGQDTVPAVGSDRPPPVVAGSHDPLLEWCVAESGCGLALMTGGSRDGLEKLAAGRAVASGVHILDAGTGAYNVAAVQEALAGLDVVVIEWAEREQGLVVAPGNPLGIRDLADAAARDLRLARRQPGSGARILMDLLLERSGASPAPDGGLPPLRSELDVGLAVLDGRADAGLAIRAVARQLRLDFLPVHRERYDLVMRRRDFFEPPMQRLLEFARSPAAREKAADLQGYDLEGLGRVRWNAP